MIVDTSALVAIIKREPEQAAFSAILEAEKDLKISAATYFQASIVLDGLRQPEISRAFDDLIDRAQIEVEPVTAEQAQIARQAYRDYGRGSGHPANLNFGDCFSYALARAKREPILFKGDDFGHTDLRSALAG
ncbi:MAG TPA: type II toxin-antitoxin system VapC family toxin [Terracidiphilus sp.]|jgi:ribonuclease VapC|nr:type II toxin-antitoxin system VapC family toxin [Terracidiphilus sp.]